MIDLLNCDNCVPAVLAFLSWGGYCTWFALRRGEIYREESRKQARASEKS